MALSGCNVFETAHSLALWVQYGDMDMAEVHDEEIVKKVLGGETSLYEALVGGYN